MPIKNQIPTVVVSNVAETFVDFLSRCADPKEREVLISGESFHADRTLVWCGDPKLVIVSYPVMHEEFIKGLGFPGTRHLAPKEPTAHLSLDVLREGHLLHSLVEYAGKARQLTLIPYATTAEFLKLVEALRTEHQLEIHLPESPDPVNLWIRDYVDTKAGFRQLASQWLADADRLLPFGMTCYDRHQAARAAFWFIDRGEACVVKADTGENGIGICIIRPETHGTFQQILEELNANSFFGDELIIVEEYIHSPNQTSPSPEIFVPKLGDGEPYIMYMTEQIIQGFSDFCGIEVSGHMYNEPWFPDLERSALTIGRGLQRLGYVGHFDLDCLVSEDGRLFLLEVNSRRTGGTHVHDFAEHVIGTDYMDKVALISYEAMKCGEIESAAELLDVIGDFLYPMNGSRYSGLVVTITTALRLGTFGCITVAPTIEKAMRLRDAVAEKIESYSRSK